MKNKSKQWLLFGGGILLIVLIVLAVLFGDKLLFTNKEDVLDGEVVLNGELDGLYAFATKREYNPENTKIVAQKNDGSEIELLKLDESLDGNYRYDYSNGKLYIIFNKLEDEGTNFLGYIDLTQGNSNYHLNILSEFKGSRDFSIAATKDIIYINTNKIMKFSIRDKKFLNSDIVFSRNRDTVMYGINENLIYNKDYDVYLLDTKNKEDKLLFSNIELCFKLNDKIIYEKYQEDNEGQVESVSYYEYNVVTKEDKVIAQSVNYSGGGIGQQNIVPYDGGYIYTDGTKLIYAKDNNYEKIYQDSEGMGLVYKISHDRIIAEVPSGHSESGYDILFDIKTKKATKIYFEDIKYDYSYIVYYK